MHSPKLLLRSHRRHLGLSNGVFFIHMTMDKTWLIRWENKSLSLLLEWSELSQMGEFGSTSWSFDHFGYNFLQVHYFGLILSPVDRGHFDLVMDQKTSFQQCRKGEIEKEQDENLGSWSDFPHRTLHNMDCGEWKIHTILYFKS